MFLKIKLLLKYIKQKRKWKNKIKFDSSCNITKTSTFEGMSKLHSYTSFSGSLGYGSYIGSYCNISAEIGRFTSIAPFVRCNAGIHPYTYPFATTSPSFFSLNPNYSQNGSTYATEQLFNEFSYYDKNLGIAVKIGSDCWIGEGVFLVGGICIGDGAVILAHAVVTKDVPPYAIVGGVPAKILKYRYSKEDIDFLLKIKWWNNNIEWFKDNWRLLSDIEKLKLYYKDKL